MQMADTQIELTPKPGASLVVIAWGVTLLVSSLADIFFFEWTGSVPAWLFLSKVGLLGALILVSWLWKPIRVLQAYFIVLLAFMTLLRGMSWLLASPTWAAWGAQKSFAAAALGVQALEIGVAVLLIAILFWLRRRRERFFLVPGDLKANMEPVKWLGQKSPSPLWSFGLVFSLVVIVAQFFMFILPLSPSASTLQKLIPLIPAILLLAALNGFTEEVIFRAAPISTIYEVVGKSQAIWMAAVLFGLAHYIGGVPSGIPGVLITTLLGWFFGKCMLDSKGMFWPWLFHAMQDVLPFTLLAWVAMGG